MRRRNADHPEGAPEPWDQDQPVWPPSEHEEPQGDDATPFGQKLSDMIGSLVRDKDRVKARVRSCLLSEGLPELYAEYVAGEVAEGWMNGDPAPIWTMPGYVPPQDDPANLKSGDLALAVQAWHDHWNEEQRRDEERRRTNPRGGRWTLLSLEPSNIQGKKFTAVFRDETTGRSKTVHFGASGYSDYTTHKDPERKQRYLERHGRGREDWNDPTTPGALSRWLLWNKPTLEASLRDFKRRFGL